MNKSSSSTGGGSVCCEPEAVEALERFAKLIDSSSFGTDAVVELSRRAPDKDVVAVCAAADEHEPAGPRFPWMPAEVHNASAGHPWESSTTGIDELVSGAVAGDSQARDLLLAEIQPLVQRYCRGRLGRSEGVIGSADDVAQDVCLAVIAALPRYEIKGLSFRAFVFGIAAHKVTDAFRAIGRNRTDPVAELPDSPIVHDGPEQRLLAAELAERLGHLLHKLTPRQREVLVLRIAVGLSAEETAQVVGSTPGAVQVTYHRALNRLRGPLDLADPDDAPTSAISV